MKQVVITGSTRGLGFAMARAFLAAGCSVTISGRNEANLSKAYAELKHYKHVLPVLCDVQDPVQLRNLWQVAYDRWGQVDYWINNAGIAQLHQPLWELEIGEIEQVININLMGTIYGSRVAMQGMLKQGEGQIFNVEGFGSNDMFRPGMSLYGTSKRAITYYTRALAKEAAQTGILVGLLSPGMMVTDFVKKPRDGSASVDAQTRRIFNLLGDRPETVANYLVGRILANKRNNVRFEWLNRSRLIWRIATSGIMKRELFDC
ncbi:MAG: SDR family oxidoreductase [Syntrophomonadaceae bacterium]|jgi:NAD(P)-dependent dehydrogenase (short-subunit alcohol dehydrogenase family)